MKTPSELINVKTSFLREFSRIQKQKQLKTLERIVHLPALRNLPEIRELKEKLALVKKTKPVAPVNDLKNSLIARNRISHCILPPFQQGIGSMFGHPHTLYPPHQEIEDVFNPYSLVNQFSGEISLSVISGQNEYDFYGGGLPFEFNGIVPGFFQRRSCGILSHLVHLFPFNYDTIVEINTDVELPSGYSSVVRLVPGELSSHFYGLVGAEGFIDVYSGALADHEHVSNGTTNNFLNAWTSAGMPEISSYQSVFTCKHSFVLPAGSNQFWIHVNTQINAYSAVGNQVVGADPDIYNYALVDFRADGSHPILRDNHYFDYDHPAPGAVKIKKMCYSIEPRYTIDPDTE